VIEGAPRNALRSVADLSKRVTDMVSRGPEMIGDVGRSDSAEAMVS
jgi:hypothetical protein